MITHPDKVLFPADGITKGELAAYYDAIELWSDMRGRSLRSPMERLRLSIKS